MSLLMWLAPYSTALLWGLGVLVGLLGIYLSVKQERADKCDPPRRTRYPRKN